MISDSCARRHKTEFDVISSRYGEGIQVVHGSLSLPFFRTLNCLVVKAMSSVMLGIVPYEQRLQKRTGIASPALDANSVSGFEVPSGAIQAFRPPAPADSS